MTLSSLYSLRCSQETQKLFLISYFTGLTASLALPSTFLRFFFPYAALDLLISFHIVFFSSFRPEKSKIEAPTRMILLVTLIISGVQCAGALDTGSHDS
jgi:hypothetical protein